MIRRSLREIAEMVGGTVEAKYEDIEISGVIIDSRNITDQALFIPFKGENTDGHRFVEQALSDGAAASFWQKDVEDQPDAPLIIVDDCLIGLQTLSRSYLQQVNPKVIGITGSNGKTTTKDMVYSVLDGQYKVKKTIGNYNNEIGLPLTICQLDEDTEVSILEMGMSGFREIAFLSELAQPDIAVITNIGESHMRDLGSQAGIAKAKFEITEGLTGPLFYDGDTVLLEDLAHDYEGDKVSVGFEPNDDAVISDVQQNGVYLEFKVGNEDTVFQLPMLGLHNARNAAYAVLVGRHLGVKEQDIADRLKHLQMTGMRMERIEGKNGSLLINDAYNASPTSMKAAIDTLNQMAGKKYIVLSDILELGPDEALYHEAVGRYLEGREMTVLTTGTAAKTISDVSMRYVTSKHFDSKEALQSYIEPLLDKDTIVLFKASRGMALETIVEYLKK